MQLMICNEVLYCTVMGLIKLSLLAMYGSIFPQRRFHWALWFTAFLVISWVIYGCLTGILQCVPVQALWDTTIEDDHCITYGTLVIVAGVHNIVLDFIILALPIPMVWSLSMSKQKKRMLVFTFAMGGRSVSSFRALHVFNNLLTHTQRLHCLDCPSSLRWKSGLDCRPNMG